MKSLREIWDNIKRTNTHIIGVPEGEERQKGTEKIFQEIIAKNFPNMGKEPLTQIQEAQRVPYKINPRRNTPRYILIKLTKIKDKEKILKAAREKKQITSREPRLGFQQIFQQKLCRPEGSGMIYLM